MWRLKSSIKPSTLLLIHLTVVTMTSLNRYFMAMRATMAQFVAYVILILTIESALERRRSLIGILLCVAQTAVTG